MRRPLSGSETMAASAGILAAITIGGVLGGLGQTVSHANAALVLVLVIVIAAAVGGRWAGGATALASALSFDFFLTEPYGSLAIKHRGELITALLLLIVGLVVGQFTHQRWAARASGEAGAQEVRGIHRVARLTADGAGVLPVLTAVQEEVAAILFLTDCRFEMLPPEPPRPELDPSGQIPGTYVYAGAGFALPPEGLQIPVQTAGRVQGWLVCDPAEQLVAVSRDRRRTAVVLADQLGMALSLADADLA